MPVVNRFDDEFNNSINSIGKVVYRILIIQIISQKRYLRLLLKGFEKAYFLIIIHCITKR